MLDRPNDAQLDNSLAEFTDSLLNDGILPEPDETLRDDLRDLQDMVSTLWQTLGSEEPESAMSVRIKNNLMAVWQETYSSPDRDKPSLWEQVRVALSTSTAVRVYGLAAAAIVLVLGLFLVIGGDGGSMAGAAIGTDDFGKLALVVGVVMMMLVWVFYRDKK